MVSIGIDGLMQGPGPGPLPVPAREATFVSSHLLGAVTQGLSHGVLALVMRGPDPGFGTAGDPIALHGG